MIQEKSTQFKIGSWMCIVILLLLIVIIIGCLVAPGIFYDQWIWKYYWGPVVSDVAGHPVTWHGVQANEGYTLVSEVTYGLILLGALYGIYQLLKRLQVTIDWWFCAALFPYILFGPVTRVLEDTTYFSEPFAPWFISPLIYFQTAFYALGFVIIGYYTQKQKIRFFKKPVILPLIIFICINLFYILLWISNVSYGSYILHPFEFILCSCVAFLPVVVFYKKITLNTIVFSGGLLVLLPPLYLIGRWMAGSAWNGSAGVRADVLVLILGLIVLICSVVYLVSGLKRWKTTLKVYRAPLNIAMLSGHLVDGLTSYVSIYDPLRMGLPSYLEKHPASNFLMELWPPLFPIVKFILIIMVIYLFDIMYKEELRHHQTLVNLLKIGIFILGVSPGVRDLLRVTMGV